MAGGRNILEDIERSLREAAGDRGHLRVVRGPKTAEDRAQQKRVLDGYADAKAALGEAVLQASLYVHIVEDALPEGRERSEELARAQALVEKLGSAAKAMRARPKGTT